LSHQPLVSQAGFAGSLEEHHLIDIDVAAQMHEQEQEQEQKQEPLLPTSS